MTTLRILYHLARADFLERIRRYSFLVLAGATMYLGYLFVPPVDANYQTVALGDVRGIYNSPWVGTMFGIMISTVMTLVAFFPIKNAVTRDRDTRVGQIIAATPMRKPIYLLGKWLSNVAVLSLLVGLMTVMAVIMQWVRAEDARIDLLTLIPPIWIIGLPTLAVIAALAVLFECIPFLQGGFGNIVYFFVYMIMIATVIEGTSDANGLLRPSNDPFGITHVIADMQHIVLHYDPEYSGALIIGGAELSDSPLLFPWHGIQWTLDVLLQRLSWMGIAAVIAFSATLPFDRFDPAKRRSQSRRRRKSAQDHNDEFISQETTSPAMPMTLTPLQNRRTRSRFFTVLRAELRLMLRGQSWWWYAIALGLIIASAVTPPDIAVIVQGIAWLWPILVWSPMGAREARHFTHELVFSVAHPVRRQLIATWLSGILVTLLMTSGALINASTTGAGSRPTAMLIGVLFVPSLALALGVWSRSSRLFEVVYLMLWYVAFNGVPALDFMGMSEVGASPERHLIYLSLTGSLFLVSVVGRKQQTQQ